VNSQTALAAGAPSVVAQVWALRFAFYCLGFVTASWTARIPAFRDALQLNHQQLGTALLMAGIGLIAAYPVARALQKVRSSRWMSYWAGILNALAFVPIALGAWFGMGVGGWMAILFLWGMTVAIVDVGINAHSIKIERRAGHAVISSFHAFFSVGNLMGAVVGALAERWQVPPLLHFAAVALLCVGGTIALRTSLYNYPIETPAHARGASWRPQRPSNAVLFLGGLTLCGFIIEGAMADWGAIFLRDQLSASLATAPLGFAAYSLAMALGRFQGDWLRDRYSSARLMAASGAVAATGLLAILLSPSILLAVAGFFTVGLGVSIIVPVLFSIAGHLPGVDGERSMAQITLIGYAGLLSGPPLLGFIAHSLGLPVAFTLLMALAIVLTLAAAWLPRRSVHRP
jgi:predicted MFS family arabinose efflux permease